MHRQGLLSIMGRAARATHGRISEQRAAERYGLTMAGEHTSFNDGTDPQGRPVEVKSATYRRAVKRDREADVRYPGYFQLQKGSHRKLLSLHQTSYVFVVIDQDRSGGPGIAGNVEDPIRRVPVSTVNDILEKEGRITSDGGGKPLLNLRWDKLFNALADSDYM